MRWDDFSSVPHFLYVKTTAGEYLINVNHIKSVRHHHAGRSMLLGEGGNYIVDMSFNEVRAQLAKFAIIHELGPEEDAEP